MNEEKSNYDGKPLLKPDRPYTYEYKYRTVEDKDLSRVNWALKKASIVKEDVIEYIKDIIFFRQNAFIFKTAAFIKRNWSRTIYFFSSFNSKLWYAW